MAGRIYDNLAKEFEQGEVFMDFDGIPLGIDFRIHLQNALRLCDVLLVVMGPHWLGVDRQADAGKLWDPADYVRIEIEIALNREIPIIPILVDGARLPSQEDLPLQIQPLIYRQAISVDMAQDFHSHMNRLIDGIRKVQRSRQIQDSSRQPSIEGSSAPRARPHALGRKLLRRVATSIKNALSLEAVFPAWVSTLAWGSIGVLTSLPSFAALYAYDHPYFDNKGYTLTILVLPGIIFGAAICLFGEHSRPTSIRKRNRLLSYAILTGSSTLGWYLAYKFAEENFNNIGFFLAGAIGGSFVVLGELFCWRLQGHWWLCSSVVVVVSGLAGFAAFYVSGYPLLGFLVWQALVLASTAISARIARK